MFLYLINWDINILKVTSQRILMITSTVATTEQGQRLCTGWRIAAWDENYMIRCTNLFFLFSKWIESVFPVCVSTPRVIQPDSGKGTLKRVKWPTKLGGTGEVSSSFCRSRYSSRKKFHWEVSRGLLWLNPHSQLAASGQWSEAVSELYRRVVLSVCRPSEWRWEWT